MVTPRRVTFRGRSTTSQALTPHAHAAHPRRRPDHLRVTGPPNRTITASSGPPPLPPSHLPTPTATTTALTGNNGNSSSSNTYSQITISNSGSSQTTLGNTYRHTSYLQISIHPGTLHPSQQVVIRSRTHDDGDVETTLRIVDLCVSGSGGGGPDSHACYLGSGIGPMGMGMDTSPTSSWNSWGVSELGMPMQQQWNMYELWRLIDPDVDANLDVDVGADVDVNMDMDMDADVDVDEDMNVEDKTNTEMSAALPAMWSNPEHNHNFPALLMRFYYGHGHGTVITTEPLVFEPRVWITTKHAYRRDVRDAAYRRFLNEVPTLKMKRNVFGMLKQVALAVVYTGSMINQSTI